MAFRVRAAAVFKERARKRGICPTGSEGRAAAGLKAKPAHELDSREVFVACELPGCLRDCLLMHLYQRERRYGQSRWPVGLVLASGFNPNTTIKRLSTTAANASDW